MDKQLFDQASYILYKILRRPITQQKLQQAYQKGMIEKQHLIPQQSYIGLSKYCDCAKWDGNYFHFCNSNNHIIEMQYPNDQEVDWFIPMLQK